MVRSPFMGRKVTGEKVPGTKGLFEHEQNKNRWKLKPEQSRLERGGRSPAGRMNPGARGIPSLVMLPGQAGGFPAKHDAGELGESSGLQSSDLRIEWALLT